MKNTSLTCCGRAAGSRRTTRGYCWLQRTSRSHVGWPVTSGERSTSARRAGRGGRPDPEDGGPLSGGAGPTHPYVYGGTINLTSARRQPGDFKTALELLKSARAGLEGNLGRDHHYSLTCFSTSPTITPRWGTGTPCGGSTQKGGLDFDPPPLEEAWARSRRRGACLLACSRSDDPRRQSARCWARSRRRPGPQRRIWI